MQEYEEALQAVSTQEPYALLQSRVRGWAHENTHKRLAIFAQQITGLAKRLGKGDVTVRIDDGGVRLPRECLANFWSNFSHLVRNAVDHGLKTKEEREQSKDGQGSTIELATRIERGDVVIEISDDGRGIDWTRVAERARAIGLPVETRADLEAAIFADGVSTAQNVTDISGRGVGLSAVRNSVRELGGKVAIQSAKGHGTEFTFRFSLARLRPSYLPGGVASHEYASPSGSGSGEGDDRGNTLVVS